MLLAMKRLFSLFAIVSLALITCCAQHDTSITKSPSSAEAKASMPNEPNAPPPSMYLISESNWQFTLPSDGWVPMNEIPTDITRALINPRRHNMILFVKEEFSGTYQEYAVLAIKSMEENDLTIISARSTIIHERKLIVLDVVSSKSSTETWTWIFFENGYGYLLSCTGLAADATLQDLCLGIGSSLIIK